MMERLPTTTAPEKRSHGRSKGMLGLYFRRLLKPQQMDLQYTWWTMVQLCIAPKTAYKNVGYHKQSKGHWARDDPAFVVVCCALVAAAALAYSAFFSHSLSRTLATVASAVLVDFLAIGAAIASGGWVLANRFLRRKHLHSHAVEQSVEWMYCWDVHCNAYLPMFLLLYVGQLVLCPLLLRAGLVPRLLSCLLYATGMSHYFYLTFLGYSALPFLERAEVFLYPIALILAATPIGILTGLNPTKLVLYIYFGRPLSL